MCEATENMDLGAVWRRVFGESGGQPDPAAAQGELARFLAHARRGQALYSALAARTRGQARQVLSGLAQEKGRHCRKLEAAYFLLSGHCAPLPAAAAPAPPSLLTALRAQHLREMEDARELGRSAALCPDENRALLFQSLSESAQQQAAALLTLLEEAL